MGLAVVAASGETVVIWYLPWWSWKCPSRSNRVPRYPGLTSLWREDYRSWEAQAPRVWPWPQVESRHPRGALIRGGAPRSSPAPGDTGEGTVQARRDGSA